MDPWPSRCMVLVQPRKLPLPWNIEKGWISGQRFPQDQPMPHHSLGFRSLSPCPSFPPPSPLVSFPPSSRLESKNRVSIRTLSSPVVRTDKIGEGKMLNAVAATDSTGDRACWRTSVKRWSTWAGGTEWSRRYWNCWPGERYWYDEIRPFIVRGLLMIVINFQIVQRYRGQSCLLRRPRQTLPPRLDRRRLFHGPMNRRNAVWTLRISDIPDIFHPRNY